LTFAVYTLELIVAISAPTRPAVALFLSLREPVMPPPDPKTLRLLSAAAELRAGGATWETVAAHLSRKAYKCRRWPIRYRDYWAAAYQAAERRRTAVARQEAVNALRALLRSQDSRAKRDAARALLSLTSQEGDGAAAAEADPIADLVEGVLRGAHPDIVVDAEAVAARHGSA
jgi:hypothetical protein